ncbi:hypothetical protein HPB49_017707 [Dermacentor silvarum]|uniref:Uncharacterized protein n=1 Tax=Dermacentor silvarum TaxID=543639 RepID=A0ACB8DQ04_DERSI|nr:hypothetical protein HPB49_017707 [Dermacentor silvarum]
MIVENQMCVQVQGNEISPEQYHNDATWTLVGERMSRLRQPPPPAASPTDLKAKVVVRPSGGLDIVKTCTTTVAVAKITSEESAANTICPNSQQNIMVVSRPNENNAPRGIPIGSSATELDRNIVKERNPLSLGSKRIGSTTTTIVVFQGPKVPNFVRYGVTLIPCRLYRKQFDICIQCG